MQKVRSPVASEKVVKGDRTFDAKRAIALPGEKVVKGDRPSHPKKALAKPAPTGAAPTKRIALPSQKSDINAKLGNRETQLIIM